MTFLTIKGVTGIFFNFRLNLKEQPSTEIPESSTSEFSSKISANNFTLSVTEDNNSGPLHTAVVADLAICLEFQQPSL